MAAISVRLNSEKKKIVSFLSEQLEKDNSTLTKNSIMEMYEDFIDRDTIGKFEKDEGGKKFLGSEEISNTIKI